MSMERPTCETCPYFEAGFCKRYPPQVYFITPDGTYEGGAGAHSPEVPKWDWCGEHPDFPAYLASLKGGKG